MSIINKKPHVFNVPGGGGEKRDRRGTIENFLKWQKNTLAYKFKNIYKPHAG